MKYTKVESVDQIKAHCLEHGMFEGFIGLSNGVRSSKTIWYDQDKDMFTVLNEVDDSEQELSPEEIYLESNIGYAIDNNSFYKYD